MSGHTSGKAAKCTAQTTWFHIFRTMIENGDVSKMGPYAYAVYSVIKSHTNFATGDSFPRQDLIAKKAGISLAQVKRALVILEKMDYLTKKKRGRSNIYHLREKIEIHDAQGRPQAVASWDYLPSDVKAAIADLKNALDTGDFGDTRIVRIVRIVRIERLAFNMNTTSGTQSNVDMASMREGPVKRALEALLANHTSHAYINTSQKN